MKDTDITLTFGDFHVPFQNTPLITKVLECIKAHKRPSRVVLNGDLSDLYQISRFLKDPNRLSLLQTEIEEGCELLSDFRKAIGPTAEMVWVGGNHEDRLRKFNWDKSPAYRNLSCLTIPSLYQLDRFKITYLEPFSVYNVGPVWITHGNIIRKFAAYSAKAAIDQFNNFVIINHTHRAGTHAKRSGRKTLAAYENGCMCVLHDVEYMPYDPDWQNAWTTITITNGIPKIDTTLVVEDKDGKQCFYWGNELIYV